MKTKYIVAAIVILGVLYVSQMARCQSVSDGIGVPAIFAGMGCYAKAPGTILRLF